MRNAVWIFLIAFLLTVLSPIVQAAELCSSVFRSENILLEINQEKALDKGIQKIFVGYEPTERSSKDLQLVAEAVYRQMYGDPSKIRDYRKKSVADRTREAIAMQMGQELLRKGLERFLYERNLLVEESRLWTHIKRFQDSNAYNLLQASLQVAVLVANGLPPIFPPNFNFKVSRQDMDTLLMKGLDSPEGIAIARRLTIKQEMGRAYNVIDRIYTYIAVAVVFIVLYERQLEALEQKRQAEGDQLFDTILNKIDESYKRAGFEDSKEDIRFRHAIQNFNKIKGRIPDKEELTLICKKIYHTESCL